MSVVVRYLQYVGATVVLGVVLVPAALVGVLFQVAVLGFTVGRGMADELLAWWSEAEQSESKP